MKKLLQLLMVAGVLSLPVLAYAGHHGDSQGEMHSQQQAEKDHVKDNTQDHKMREGHGEDQQCEAGMDCPMHDDMKHDDDHGDSDHGKHEH